MKYGIIGTGAIGGYYGAKLAHAGQEVHFLLRSDYEYVRQHGLQVESCDGSFHLADVNAYQHTQDMPQCDVVLVCLKSVNNSKLLSLLPPLLHDHTLVVLIPALGCEEPRRNFCRKDDRYDGFGDTLFAVYATGLRLSPSYGDILSLHPSLADSP